MEVLKSKTGKRNIIDTVKYSIYRITRYLSYSFPLFYVSPTASPELYKAIWDEQKIFMAFLGMLAYIVWIYFDDEDRKKYNKYISKSKK